MYTNRSLSALAAAAATVLLLVACSPDVTVPEPTTVTVDPSENRGIAPSPPTDPRPEIAWPLVGSDAQDAGALDRDRPALAVKIENSEQARPQTNLEHADVVFEQYVEYGISRLIAVFHSEMPDEVGPIRSLRPMDANVIGSYEGPLVFSGAQSRFINAASASGQKLIAQDIGAYGFFRSAGKPAPHNLHGRPADFLAQSEGLSAPTSMWAFAYPSHYATAQVEGQEVQGIDVLMSSRSNPVWQWSESDEVWLRYHGTQPHVAADGTQLSATNVVMLWVDVVQTGRSGGSSVPETIMMATDNPGYVVSGNKLIEVLWSKSARTEHIQITTLDGDPVSLIPGQTWVELVPQSGVGHSTRIEFEYPPPESS